MTMIGKVTEEGLVIPSSWLDGVEEVEIRKEGPRIMIEALAGKDPVLNLGRHPVSCGVTDASERHDKYLSGPSA